MKKRLKIKPKSKHKSQTSSSNKQMKTNNQYKLQSLIESFSEKPAEKRASEPIVSENPVQDTTSTPSKNPVQDTTTSEKNVQETIPSSLVESPNTTIQKPAANQSVKPPENSNVSKNTLISNELQTAISLHDEGVNGDKEAVQKAFDMFKSLYEREPNNAEIAGYYGSTTALMGRDEENLTKRMKYVLSGLKLLDSVIEKSPDLSLLRFLRGNVCYRLPEMYFHRTDTAIEDFKYLVNLYEQDNRILTKSEYETVLKNLIKACETLNRTVESEHYREKFKALLQISNHQISNVSEERNEEQIEKESGNQSSEAFMELDEESSQIYQKALHGDTTDVKKAIEHFSSLEVKHPNDPLIKAYSIDCNSLLGRNTSNTFEMFSAGIKAMKALDELVNENPNQSKIRKIRAFQSFRLPEAFFRKTASAIKDFEDLIRQYEKDRTIFTSEEYVEILFHLGEGYERLGMKDEASSVWNKLLQSNSSTEMKEKLKERQSILAFKPIGLETVTISQPEQLFKVGKELHEIGAKGSRQAAQQALDIWEKAAEAFPDNVTAKTYHAASVTLMAKFADEAPSLIGDTIKGLKLLKSAFNHTNQTTELLLLRGYIYNVLPEAFFHKTESAIKDLKAAKSLYKQGDQSMTREQYLQLLVDLGKAYKRSQFHDKAQKTWSLLAKEDTEGQYKEFLVSKGVETN